MWKDIDNKAKNFIIDDYTKGNLCDIALREKFAQEGLSKFVLFVNNLNSSENIKTISEKCGFKTFNYPVQAYFSDVKKPLDFNNVTRFFKYKQDFVEISYDKYSKGFSFCVYTKEESIVEEIRQLLVTHLEFVTTEEESFFCNFSYFTSSEGRATYSSKLSGHVFSQIKNNYVSELQDTLENIIEKLKGHNKAKLVILNGPPGTGKTHFIRSLCSGLSDQFDFEFSLEPMNLLSSSSYLVQSLLADDDDSKGKILILEDIDDILSENNKEKYGDIVSKFLNLLDGFIGQGKNFYVIVTCNTEEAKLNKAVTRAGRCLSYVEFQCFNKDTAAQWFIEKGLTEEEFKDQLEKISSSSTDRLGFRTQVKGAVTLSEMFRILHEVKPETITSDSKTVNSIKPPRSPKSPLKLSRALVDSILRGA